jgi:hypothetical protein
MNNIFKRKITDALQLNNIYKKFKSTKTDIKSDINQSNNLDEYNKNNKNYNNKKRRSKNKNQYYLNRQNDKHDQYNLQNQHNSYIQYPNIPNIPNIPNRKEQIPKRIREMVWNTHNGEKYSSKCYVSWCNNIINVFNYQVGHDIPESKGGTLDLSNLKPICGNCNLSMGNKYTITEWCTLINKNTLSNTTNTLPILDIKNIENIDTKKLLKSQLNILKNSKKGDANANEIITKSLQQIEDIIDNKDNKDGIPDLEGNPNNEPLYNKFAIVTLLMVILNIICF